MKYFDIYMETAPKKGYSVFVKAENKTKAVAKMRDEHMCYDDNDSMNIKNITEITREEYEASL